jgi:hypothetical protein
MPTDTSPNLFIVGAQKAGTSALNAWLGQHPEVCMSFPKEPGFLAFGTRGYAFPDGYGNPAPASQYVVRDERTYRNLFASASERQHILGEASTWYFAIPGMAAKIHAFNPAARIIIMLRNPVERAYSAWCHARGDGLEPCESFAAALDRESSRGEVEFLLRYRQMGLYSRALAEYQASFPAAQLLVLFYDDMRNRPLALWQRVCEFLAIDPACQPQFNHTYNRSGQPRNRLLHSLTRSYQLKRVVRSLLPHRIAIKVKEQVDGLNLQKFPGIDATSRSELLAFYRSDIQQLSELTQQDLSAWLQ